MALESTYDAKNVVAAIGEVNLVGFGPDAFFSVEYNSDFTTVQVGADGRTNTRTRTNDRSATITFTCMQHAPVNDLLTALLASDELGGLGVRPFILQDLTTGVRLVAENCWIKKPPTTEYSAEAGSWEWTFETDKLIAVYGDPITRSV